MMDHCMFKFPNIHYLSLMSKYIGKGDINNEDSKLNSKLMKLFDDKKQSDKTDIIDSNEYNVSQFLYYFFQLCNNGDCKFDKPTIERALNKCKDEQCEKMLKEYNQINN